MDCLWCILWLNLMVLSIKTIKFDQYGRDKGNFGSKISANYS